MHPPSSTCWALISFHSPSIGHMSSYTLSLTTPAPAHTHMQDKQTHTHTEMLLKQPLCYLSPIPFLHFISSLPPHYKHNHSHIFFHQVPCVPQPPLTSPLVQFPLFSFLLLFHTPSFSMLLLPSSHFPLCCSSPHQSVSLRSDRDAGLWWRLPECQHISIHQHTHMHSLNTQE